MSRRKAVRRSIANLGRAKVIQGRFVPYAFPEATPKAKGPRHHKPRK